MPAVTVPLIVTTAVGVATFGLLSLSEIGMPSSSKCASPSALAIGTEGKPPILTFCALCTLVPLLIVTAVCTVSLTVAEADGMVITP